MFELLEKCNDLNNVFKKCANELKTGKQEIEQTEQKMDSLQTTILTFSNTVDSLGVHMLQDNAAVGHRQLQVDRLKREIASKQETLAKILQKTEQHVVREKEQRINNLRDERARLEVQLAKVQRDINDTYESLYESQQRLFGLRDLRDRKCAENQSTIMSLKAICDISMAKKHQLLAIGPADAGMDLSDVYVSPAEFKAMQMDIETLKHKQQQVDRHIQMQLEEREFLKTAANDILQKVYDLERKVRKETGDHGLNSPLSRVPNWHQDLGGPGIWFTCQILSPEQLKALKDQQSHYFESVCPVDDEKADDNNDDVTSGENREEIVVVDVVRPELHL